MNQRTYPATLEGLRRLARDTLIALRQEIDRAYVRGQSTEALFRDRSRVIDVMDLVIPKDAIAACGPAIGRVLDRYCITRPDRAELERDLLDAVAGESERGALDAAELAEVEARDRVGELLGIGARPAWSRVAEAVEARDAEGFDLGELATIKAALEVLVLEYNEGQHPEHANADRLLDKVRAILAAEVRP